MGTPACQRAFTKFAYEIALFSLAGELSAELNSISPICGALIGAVFAISSKFITPILERIFDNTTEGKILKFSLRFFFNHTMAVGAAALAGFTIPYWVALELSWDTLLLAFLIDFMAKNLCDPDGRRQIA